MTKALRKLLAVFTVQGLAPTYRYPLITRGKGAGGGISKSKIARKSLIVTALADRPP